MASGRRSSRKAAAQRPAASRAAAALPAGRRLAAPKSNAGPLAQQQLPAPTPAIQKLDTTCDTTTAISQNQSMELMQTFLYSGVSSILFLRDLLPPEHFGKMYYAAINTHCSYDVLTSGRQSYHPKHGERRPPGESMAVLKRDTHGPGDKIIEWLETGVFDALGKGYLAEMQLSIMQDDHDPTKVLELYSFTFQYSHLVQGGSSERDVSVQMNGPANTKVSLFNARQALTQVVKNMVAVNAHMPHLPDDRHLLMHIIYNDQRPRGYQAVGFEPTSDDISFPTNTQGWSMETEQLGRMFTGYQTVGLRVSYLSPSVAVDVLDDEVVVIPDDLKYGPSFSRLTPIETSLCPLGKSRDLPPKVTKRSAPEAMSDDDYGTEPSIADPSEHIPSHRSPTPVTQEGDREVQEYLQRAQQPVQGNSLPDTLLVSSSHAITKLEFSRETVARLDQLRSLREPPRKARTGESISGSDRVQCQCESSAREENMIYCSFCDSFQHANCYGYLGPGLERLPATHICYACLFTDQHLQLSTMDYLVRLRRILVFLQYQDATPEVLAKSLNYRLGDITYPLKDLGKQGFVSTSPESKRSKGARKLSLCRSPGTYGKMIGEFFDPTRNISPYLVSPPTTESCQVSSKRHGDSIGSPRTQKISRQSQVHNAPIHSPARPEDAGPLTPKRTNHKAEVTPKVARAQDTLSFKSSAWYTPSHKQYL